MSTTNDMLSLATAMRAADHFDLNEGICNHFSLRSTINGIDGVLLHPNDVLWSCINPNDILFLTDTEFAHYIENSSVPEKVEITAFYIHNSISKRFPDTKAILHTHMPYATALCCLEDIPNLSVHQNFMRFNNRISVVKNYDGLIYNQHLADKLTNEIENDDGIVLLKNHGVLSLSSSIETAFDDLYYFEKACKVLFIALSPGNNMRQIEAGIVKKTGLQFSRERELQANLFFSGMRTLFFNDYRGDMK